MTILRTPRLVLRRAHAGDLDDLHAVFGEPRAMRYWSRPAHTRLDETRAMLDHLIAATGKRADEFVIEHEGRVAGKSGIWRDRELGFILHPGLWGRGLAREAVAAVLGHLFGRADVDGLTAETDPRNTASLRLLTGLGFAETGRAERTMQWGDEWCDSVYLALSCDAWLRITGRGSGAPDEPSRGR